MGPLLCVLNHNLAERIPHAMAGCHRQYGLGLFLLVELLAAHRHGYLSGSTAEKFTTVHDF